MLDFDSVYGYRMKTQATTAIRMAITTGIVKIMTEAIKYNDLTLKLIS
jgi:hypothetical protein